MARPLFIAVSKTELQEGRAPLAAEGRHRVRRQSISPFEML